MCTATDEILKHEKKIAKRAAKDLFYPDIVIELIDKAQTLNEITRIMKSARKGVYDDGNKT